MFDHAKIAFIRALDALVDYHHLMRDKAMSTTTVTAPAKKPNKFISFMEHIGHDLKVGLPPAVKIAETMGETAISIFAPGASALFNQTVSAIATAEQNYPTSGSGTQKSAAVISIMGNLIKQGLTDAGMSNDNATVQKYIEAALLIAKVTPVLDTAETTAAPAPVVAAAPAPAPVIPAPVGKASEPIATDEPSVFGTE
jgi:hypothetical protein